MCYQTKLIQTINSNEVSTCCFFLFHSTPLKSWLTFYIGWGHNSNVQWVPRCSENKLELWKSELATFFIFASRTPVDYDNIFPQKENPSYYTSSFAVIGYRKSNYCFIHDKCLETFTAITSCSVKMTSGSVLYC